MESIKSFGTLIDFLDATMKFQTSKKEMMHLIYLGIKIQDSNYNFQEIENEMNFIQDNLKQSETQLQKIYDKKLNFSQKWDNASLESHNQQWIENKIQLNQKQFQLNQAKFLNSNNQQEYLQSQKFYSQIHSEFNIVQQKKNSEISKINCIICQDNEQKEIYTLTDCKHRYHKECVINLIKSSNTFPIRCPDLGCRKEIQKQDIQNLAPQVIQNLQKKASLQYLLENRDKYFVCPTINCKGAFEIKEKQDNYYCEECQNYFCAKCLKLSHDIDENCNETNSFIQSAREKQFQQCLKCKAWIEKSYGCNHIICKCKYEFCYNCGRQWQKNRPCECISDFQLFSTVGMPFRPPSIIQISMIKQIEQPTLPNLLELNNNQPYFNNLITKIPWLEQKIETFQKLKTQFNEYFWSK